MATATSSMPELDKLLLLKTMHTLAAGYGIIRLVVNWKLLSFWMVYIVLVLC